MSYGEDYDKDNLDVNSPAELAFKLSGKKRAAGFVISPRLRQALPEFGGGNPGRGFLEAAREALDPFFIFVTQGTYDDLIWDQLPKTQQWQTKSGLEGHCLRGGKQGGIIQLAALVERRKRPEERREIGVNVKGPIDTLFFLLHPIDHEEVYPEDRALLRSSIRNNVVVLTSFESAKLWSSWEAPRLAHSGKTDDRRSCNLALIAHDQKKLEMCRWVVEHRNKLSCFKQILTTGTTGHWVTKFLRASGIPDAQIDPRYSGPEGGDIQIADSILRGECQHVVFFVDPMTSHPHEADIQALVRVCSLTDVKVNLRLTEASATSWIEAYVAV